MKKWFLFLSLLTAAAALVGCSNHSRTVSGSITPEEVFGRLRSFTDRGGSNSDGISFRSFNSAESKKFGDLAFDDNTVIYYSRAPGPFGQLRNVADFRDFSTLGFNVTPKDVITDVEVFFADNPKNQPHNGLLIAIKKKDSAAYDIRSLIATSPAHVDKAKFEVSLSDEDATLPHVIVLKSYDVDSAHHLRGVIQLKVFDANGKSIGKFPTLAGYAQ